MVEVSLTRLDLNRRGKATNGFIKVTAPIQRDSLIVVSVGVLRVDLNSGCVILDSKTELA